MTSKRISKYEKYLWNTKYEVFYIIVTSSPWKKFILIKNIIQNGSKLLILWGWIGGVDFYYVF